jgi:hypothetical protein
MERSSCRAYLICGCFVVGIAANASFARAQAPEAGILAGVPLPGPAGWGADDERGNGNTQGLATRLRFAASLVHPQSRVYELGRVVSSTMPQNPFGDAPVELDYLSTRGIPFTRHAVFVHTGWGTLWRDPESNTSFTTYYSQGPGLSLDAQEYLAERTVVLVALDNPFTDPVPTPPLPATLPDLPFSVHHNNLTRHGIYQIQNLVLDEMARDRVSLSCAIVLPLRIRGGAGSTVRPIAVGPPRG